MYREREREGDPSGWLAGWLRPWLRLRSWPWPRVRPRLQPGRLWLAAELCGEGRGRSLAVVDDLAQDSGLHLGRRRAEEKQGSEHGPDSGRPKAFKERTPGFNTEASSASRTVFDASRLEGSCYMTSRLGVTQRSSQREAGFLETTDQGPRVRERDLLVGAAVVHHVPCGRAPSRGNAPGCRPAAHWSEQQDPTRKTADHVEVMMKTRTLDPGRRYRQCPNNIRSSPTVASRTPSLASETRLPNPPH